MTEHEAELERKLAKSSLVISELSYLLGMSHVLISFFVDEFNEHQSDIYTKLNKGILKYIYQDREL
jgi:hypothetical protein